MSKTSSAAKRKYNEKAYDRFTVSVKKGDKEKIAAFATARGESLNGLVSRAIAELMERESAEQKEAAE